MNTVLSDHQIKEIYEEIQNLRVLKGLRPSSIDNNTVAKLKNEIDVLMNDYINTTQRDTEDDIFNKLSILSVKYNEYIMVKRDQKIWYDAINKTRRDILKMVLGVDYDPDFILLS